MNVWILSRFPFKFKLFGLLEVRGGLCFDDENGEFQCCLKKKHLFDLHRNQKSNYNKYLNAKYKSNIHCFFMGDISLIFNI